MKRLLLLLAAVPFAAPWALRADTVDEFNKRAELVLADASANERVAVIFIPGIPGSKLFDESESLIWGEGITDPKQIRLLSEAIPRTKPRLLATYDVGPIHDDSYHTIIRDLQLIMRSDAAVIEWPYDWRLDVQVLAQQLERTIETLKGRPIVIVAHSMGAVVTWFWQATHYHPPRSPDDPDVRRLVLLGPPLSGSCEMARTLLEGFTAPAGQDTDGLSALLRRLVVGGLRPAAFTYPSVFELLPLAQTEPSTEADSCVVWLPDKTSGAEVHAQDFLRLAFWKEPLGRAMIDGAWKRLDLSESDFYGRLEVVVTQAKATRLAIQNSLSVLNVPTTMIYASRFDTTRQLQLQFPGDRRILRKGDVTITPRFEPGDGRVLARVALNEQVPMKPGSSPLDVLRVGETHGRLPASSECRAAVKRALVEVTSSSMPDFYAGRLLASPEKLALFSQRGTIDLDDVIRIVKERRGSTFNLERLQADRQHGAAASADPTQPAVPIPAPSPWIAARTRPTGGETDSEREEREAFSDKLPYFLSSILSSVRARIESESGSLAGTHLEAVEEARKQSREFRAEKHLLTYRMNMYYGNLPSLIQQWQDAEEALTRADECASSVDREAHAASANPGGSPGARTNCTPYLSRAEAATNSCLIGLANARAEYRK